MKVVRVVAAVICDDIQTKHKIYATARGYGEYKGGWEFPGGKLEADETPAQCLERELMEELDLRVHAGDILGEVTRQENGRAIHLVFVSAMPLDADALSLHVHGKAVWALPSELHQYAFCPADAAFLSRGLL